MKLHFTWLIRRDSSNLHVALIFFLNTFHPDLLCVGLDGIFGHDWMQIDVPVAFVNSICGLVSDNYR